jgi:cytochrome c peroxidase
MRRFACFAALLALHVVVACRATEPFLMPVPLGLDLYARVPADNPLTRERVELGRRLFFDPSLSAYGRVSCASCHIPERAFADTLPTSAGVYGRAGRRNAPSLLNVTYRSPLFWDGRAARIEEQVLLPLQSETEMDRSLEALVRGLADRSEYRSAFQRAFQREVNAEDVARALASFVRTLRSGGSAVDRYRNGEGGALTEEARRGFALFNGRAGCSRCHAGPQLSDGDFHNTGMTVGSADPGRFAVTGDMKDLGAFRTPSLRDVAITAPYMHDGSLDTLEAVIDFYDGGGRANANLDPLIRPLRLTDSEKRDLVSFLEALTGSGADHGSS